MVVARVIIEELYYFLSGKGTRVSEFTNWLDFVHCEHLCEGVIRNLSKSKSVYIDEKLIEADTGLVVIKTKIPGNGIIYREFNIAEYPCSCPTHKGELGDKFIFENWKLAESSWRSLAASGEVVYEDRNHRIHKRPFQADRYFTGISSPEGNELIIFPSDFIIFSNQFSEADIESLIEKGIAPDTNKQYSKGVKAYLENIIKKELDL